MAGKIAKPPVTDNEEVDRVAQILYESLIRLEKEVDNLKSKVDAEHP